MAKVFYTWADFTSTSHATVGRPRDGVGTTIGDVASVTLTAPVGDRRVARCKNIEGDVTQVQVALNRFEQIDGGPKVKLEVDGKIGPKTEKAIWFFQQKWGLLPKGWKWPDMIVDPDGQTIERLRLGPPSTPSGVPAAQRALPRVLEILLATRGTLLFADLHRRMPEGPTRSLDFVGGAAVAKVERHFKSSTPAQLAADIGWIDRLFATVSGVATDAMAATGRQLIKDEPAAAAVGAIAFTQGGGIHTRSATNPEDYILAPTGQWLFGGNVYLCPRFRNLTAEQQAYALIHELCHFSGPKTEPIVDDHGYFHKNSIDRLNRHQCLHNADSFAQFAFDSVGKANFNVERSE